MRYYYTPFGMVKIHPPTKKKKQWTISNSGEDVKQQEFTFIAGENAKWYRHFGGQFGNFL